LQKFPENHLVNLSSKHFYAETTMATLLSQQTMFSAGVL